jgi:hypothetical protein
MQLWETFSPSPELGTDVTARHRNPMSMADAYRIRAQDCRQRAEDKKFAADREKWLSLAVEWERLADSVDRAAMGKAGLDETT